MKKYIGLLAVLVVGGLAYMQYANKSVRPASSAPQPIQASYEGLAVGQFGGNGDQLRYLLVNSSERRGDVVFFITQNGARLCETIFLVEANSRNNKSYYCAGARQGSVRYDFYWADTVPSLAAVARRIR